MQGTVRLALYQAKHRNPTAIQVIKILSTNLDLSTGNRTPVLRTVTILKAVLGDRKISNKFIYDLAFVAANKNFTEGGLFKKGQRTFLIDRTDLPQDFEIAPDDYVRHNNKFYLVKTVDEFGETNGDNLQVGLIVDCSSVANDQQPTYLTTTLNITAEAAVTP